MKTATKYLPSNNSRLLSAIFVMLLLAGVIMHALNSHIPCSLKMLNIQGTFSFHDVRHASRDFGNQYTSQPSAVLYPKTVSDISTVIKGINRMGPDSKLTIAARGHGHSLQGQAQAPGGIVILMESLQEQDMMVHDGKDPYIDAAGGCLWIDILHESLKHGLAPKSWTDYLYLTVGGTLSNAGISGQTFRHGPQISNVHLLEIVTGKGDIVNCSAEQNADLFFAVLGGLGQFGIITRARIALEPAPKMVRWIRVLYSDFTAFTEDQEKLISEEYTFDYMEGFVIKNRTGLLNDWRSFLNPRDPFQASQFNSEGRTLYCLEMTKNFNPDESELVDQEVALVLSQLQYIPSTLFQSEVSYLEFLNRVRISELKLRSKGLWDVPHPWLNLLIPRTRVKDFADEVFGNMVTDSSNGPILIYPVKKSKWDNRTSAVIPDEEIFYLVAFLTSVTSMSDHDGLRVSLRQNKNIVEFCNKAGIQMKQYLPHYVTTEEWKKHFGQRWEALVHRKLEYDPLAILNPGQRIFQKATIRRYSTI